MTTRACWLWLRPLPCPHRGGVAGRLYGIGLAAIVEPRCRIWAYIRHRADVEQRAKAGPKNGAIASATVAVDLLGGVNVVANAPAARAHMTVAAQVVADVFGPHAGAGGGERGVRHRQRTPGRGRRQLQQPLRRRRGRAPCIRPRLRDKLARVAAATLGCARGRYFAEGQVFSEAAPERRQPLRASPPARTGRRRCCPEGVEPGLRETAFWTPRTLAAPDAADRVNTSAAYGFVVDVCGLEVDPATGRRARRPLCHRARCRPPAQPGAGRRPDPGAFAQGLGAALMESSLRRRRRLPERHLSPTTWCHLLRGARPGDRAPGDAQPVHAAGAKGSARATT